MSLTAIGALVWRSYRRPGVEVTTDLVTRGAVARRILVAGTLQPVRTIDIGAQVSGTVQSLEVDFNSKVRSGQVLARLEPSLFQAILQEARASLQDAEAALVQARADLGGLHVAEKDAQIRLQRAETLARSELIAQADLDAARIQMIAASDSVQSGAATVQDASATVDAARTSVVQAEVNLDHTVIRSPVDGVVLSRNVDVGQTIASAVQAPVLFTIATDLRQLQIQADVDESEVGGLQVGELVAFTVDAYAGATFSGALSQVRLGPIPVQTTTATTIASSTLPQTTTDVATVVSYAVMIDVDNHDERLRPGMTALLALSGLRRDDVVRVPNSALTFRPPTEVLNAIGEPEPLAPGSTAAETGSPRAVWRFDGRRFDSVALVPGLSDAQWTEVAAGDLRPGERLVTSARVDR
jgi:HlyD family secretion protein